MDSRLDLFGALGLDIGDAHLIRNAGGMVTDDVLRSLALSQRSMGTREVVIIHHTECGMAGFDDDAFRSELAAESGVRPTWSVHGFTDVPRNRCRSRSSWSVPAPGSRTATTFAASSSTPRPRRSRRSAGRSCLGGVAPVRGREPGGPPGPEATDRRRSQGRRWSSARGRPATRCSPLSRARSSAVRAPRPRTRASESGCSRHSRWLRSITSEPGTSPSSSRCACGRMSTSSAPSATASAASRRVEAIERSTARAPAARPQRRTSARSRSPATARTRARVRRSPASTSATSSPPARS